VPKDIRERKGSFFTPEIWVNLSQKYIANVFGKNWQDEYYVWDCAAGTGNLLAGLENKYNIWASTLDKADVDVMHTRIKHDGLNLLEEHCFQFDFLNDDFRNLPDKLRKIIKNSPEKLIVYINPPYAEHGNTAKRESKSKVNVSRIHDKYIADIGSAGRELFALFLIRIYTELENCKIANFAKLKALSASNFESFRNVFKAKLKKLFLAPADTFDNVGGKFPIGFHIWDTSNKVIFKHIIGDLYDKNGKFVTKKSIWSYDGVEKIGGWLNTYKPKISREEDKIGFLNGGRNDFQNQNLVFIVHHQYPVSDTAGYYWINRQNVLQSCIYLAVRKVIPADWLNDRDQFLYPNDGWQTDKVFQSDCLAYTLFHSSNNVSSKHGINHWIPFTESEVKARDSFDSNFMTDFIAGKLKHKGKNGDQLSAFEQGGKRQRTSPLKFSAEARAVFKAGQKLWTYYHAQKKCNVNASFYDIREYFQGRNDKGRMNPTSPDVKYNELVGELREKLKVLAKKIEPKIYEYGFLRE
jgi:hypothetical protein